MAGKARRAAARQAQLNRNKRKKGHRGPSGIPATTAVANGHHLAEAVAVPVDGDADGVAAAPRPAPRPAPTARFTPAGRPLRADAGPRTRGERPAAYNYVGAELRRIGVLSGSVIVVLIVLGIFL